MGDGDRDEAPLERLIEMSNALLDTVRKPRHLEIARVIHAVANAARDQVIDRSGSGTDQAAVWSVLERVIDRFESAAARDGITVVSVVAPNVPLHIECNATALRRAIAKRITSALAVARLGQTVVVELSTANPSTSAESSRTSLIVTVTPDGGERPLVLEDLLITEARPRAAPLVPRLAALIAESDDAVRGGIAAQLEFLGLEVQAVASMEAAQSALRERRLDLAVVDLTADAEHNEYVTRHLHASGTPTLLVVERSALTGPIFPHHHALISRPIPWSRLETAVDAALGRTKTRSHKSTSDIVRNPERTGAAPRADARILVVEDSDTNRRLMQRLLRHYGRSCDLAGDGAEAVERCRRIAYDLVFMDCRMPQVDGYEATRRIRRELGPAPPIIALTGESSDDERLRCEAAGMNDFLPKPVDHTAVADVLNRFLG